MDRAMCAKRFALQSANFAVVLQVLNGFIAIGALVGPFTVFNIPALTCPDSINAEKQVNSLAGGTLSFAPGSYNYAATGGPNLNNIKYTDPVVVVAGIITSPDNNCGKPTGLALQQFSQSCLSWFTPPGLGAPAIPLPAGWIFPLCYDLNRLGVYGNAAVRGGQAQQGRAPEHAHAPARH